MLGSNRHLMVPLRDYRRNRRVRLASVCSRISPFEWGAVGSLHAIAAHMPQKTDPPGGGSRAGRIDRRQGIGGGAAPIGVLN